MISCQVGSTLQLIRPARNLKSVDATALHPLLSRFWTMTSTTHPTAKAVASTGTSALGELPEWNLADLYPGMEAFELKSDLDNAAVDAVEFETRWKGKLAAEAAKGAKGGLGQCL